jgi:hypothetical protein
VAEDAVTVYTCMDSMLDTYDRSVGRVRDIPSCEEGTSSPPLIQYAGGHSPMSTGAAIFLHCLQAEMPLS